MSTQDRARMVDTLLHLEPLIRRMGEPSHGEDLYQEVCVRILSRVHHADSPRRLILKIAKDLTIDIIRRERRRSCRSLNTDGVQSVCVGLDPISAFEKNELRCRVNSAIDKLHPKQAEVIRARYHLGEPDQMTARRLRVSVETIRTRRKAATKRLKRSLKDLTESGRREQRLQNRSCLK